MTDQEYRDARARAWLRADTGYADNGGAPWHSVSCLCRPCTDSDARFIGPACVPLWNVERLFSQ